MKRLIAVYADDILNSAQQLEARCDPAFIAQELRALVAAAPPSVDAALFDQTYRTLTNIGHCRCGTRDKNAGSCSFCQTVKAVSDAKKAR